VQAFIGITPFDTIKYEIDKESGYLGITTVDRGAADDKIIAVLEGDALWGGARDIGGVPEALVNRLRHYFATYKADPGAQSESRCATRMARRGRTT